MYDFLIYFTYIIGIIPILILKIRGKAYRDEVNFIKPFVWLVVVSVLYEFIATDIFSMPSAIWFRTYTLLEFLAVFFFFYKVLSKRYKLFFAAFFSLFVIAFIILLFYWSDIGHMKGDSYLSVVETIFVLSATVLWFKDIFASVSETSLLQSPAFYFISGFVIYFSGTLFLFLLAEIIVNDPINFKSYWILNIIFNIVLRIFLIIGIWKGQQKSVRYSG